MAGAEWTRGDAWGGGGLWKGAEPLKNRKTTKSSTVDDVEGLCCQSPLRSAPTQHLTPSDSPGSPVSPRRAGRVGCVRSHDRGGLDQLWKVYYFKNYIKNDA